jgi:DNA-binding LacI/PurR family transcriptional regulator
MIPGDVDPQLRARTIGAALDANTDATAMLIHNDGALADLPMLFLERGLSIPRDLSVVSLFPERFGRMFSLPYTAIETSATAVTARAVTLLAARIENPDRKPTRELFTPEIIDRGSSRTA